MNGKSWRSLRNWYKIQTSRVRANGLISDKFPVQQGACQRGLLSHWLFLCFNNDIPQILTKHCRMLTVNYTPCNPVMHVLDVKVDTLVKQIAVSTPELKNTHGQ
jgi:hypothetical protein